MRRGMAEVTQQRFARGLGSRSRTYAGILANVQHLHDCCTQPSSPGYSTSLPKPFFSDMLLWNSSGLHSFIWMVDVLRVAAIYLLHTQIRNLLNISATTPTAIPLFAHSVAASCLIAYPLLHLTCCQATLQNPLCLLEDAVTVLDISTQPRAPRIYLIPVVFLSPLFIVHLNCFIFTTVKLPDPSTQLTSFQGLVMDSHFVSTMEAAQYQYQMMDPEPGVGLPDLTQYQQQHMHMLSRRSNASVEHWLTSESPVARASFCNGSVYPQDQYRLPSLSLETAIPDSLPFPEPQPLYPLQYRRYELNDSPVEEPLHHLHLSDGEFHPHHMDEHYTWHSSNGSSRSPQEGPWLNNQDYLHHRYMVPPPSPYSASSMLYDSSNGSAFPSPELQHTAYPTHIPRSLPLDDCEMDEDEETSGGKPYAQLIQECLLQAPGHRMMLRDIYAWFEQNTTKPRESGGNGWQNSIRHNLSMNKVRSRHPLAQNPPLTSTRRSRMTRPWC